MSIENPSGQPPTPEIKDPVGMVRFLAANVIEQCGDRRMNVGLAMYDADWEDPESGHYFLLQSFTGMAGGILHTSYFLRVYSSKKSHAANYYYKFTNQGEAVIHRRDKDGHIIPETKDVDETLKVIEYLASAPSKLEPDERKRFREIVADDVAHDIDVQSRRKETLATRRQFGDQATYAKLVQDAMAKEPLLTEDEIRAAVERRNRRTI
ncbi:MAG: hypothetical protein JWO61_396 [Candidatus Saccharibacteria bacterium]|nr:hypothetical protein [Candidatus Saccharibacteria bacterium]